jgi:hypothetical protein
MGLQLFFDLEELLEEEFLFLKITGTCLRVLNREGLKVLVDPFPAESHTKEDVFAMFGKGVQLSLCQFLIRERHGLDPLTADVLFFVLPLVLLEQPTYQGRADHSDVLVVPKKSLLGSKIQTEERLLCEKRYPEWLKSGKIVAFFNHLLVYVLRQILAENTDAAFV